MKLGRQRRNERRRDPEYSRRERDRDAARRKVMLANEHPEKRADRASRQRAYESARRGTRNAGQREAARRRYLDPVYRAKQAMASRLRTFKLTREEFNTIKSAQGNRCPLCSKDLPAIGSIGAGRNAEHIDHDHETGRVRGILCGGCNTALGKLGDDAVGLRRALEYVSEPGDPDC